MCALPETKDQMRWVTAYLQGLRATKVRVQIRCRRRNYSDRRLGGKLGQLELDYGSIIDLHAQLKNGQPDEVAALVNRIRAEDPSEARPPLEASSITGDSYADGAESNEDMASVASEANWDSFNQPQTGYGEMPRNTMVPPNPFYTGMPDDIPIDPALAGLEFRLNQCTQPNTAGFPQNTAISTQYDQNQDLNIYGLPLLHTGAPMSARQLFQSYTPSMLRSNIPILRQGMALHGRAMPEACTAYSESQVEGLISDVELNADHEIPNVRLCELSSIAAVAAQYVRGHLQPGVIEFFYDAAKHFFEDCMKAPLPHLVPLKICAMLALAKILSKSFLAFVYIDLGLYLAKGLDDPLFETPANSQRPDFVEAQRVRMTLLSIRGYAHEYGGLGGRHIDAGYKIEQRQDTWRS